MLEFINEQERVSMKVENGYRCWNFKTTNKEGMLRKYVVVPTNIVEVIDLLLYLKVYNHCLKLFGKDKAPR